MALFFSGEGASHAESGRLRALRALFMALQMIQRATSRRVLPPSVSQSPYARTSASAIIPSALILRPGWCKYEEGSVLLFNATTLSTLL